MRTIQLDQWFSLLTSFRRTALHVEQHPIYRIDLPAMVPWLGGATVPPAPDYESDTWAALVRDRIEAGGSIDRIRIHREPPTPYQQWLRWIGARHMAAGEVHRYLNESAASEAGVLPTEPFPGRDWWLLDNEQLMVFTHTDGDLVAVELHSDERIVGHAHEWWARAVAHAVVEIPSPTK